MAGRRVRRRRRAHEQGVCELVGSVSLHAACSVVFGRCRIAVCAISRLVNFTVSNTIVKGSSVLSTRTLNHVKPRRPMLPAPWSCPTSEFLLLPRLAAKRNGMPRVIFDPVATAPRRNQHHRAQHISDTASDISQRMISWRHWHTE
jgi:hypothetical protein